MTPMTATIATATLSSVSLFVAIQLARVFCST
jgi:hypothetical protein